MLLTPAEQDLLTRWPVGALRAVRQPGSGTINRTLLIESERGTYALRCYRQPGADRAAREHEVITYACAQGLPAVAPIALAGGATIAELDGGCYALFPQAPGAQLSPAQLDDTAIGAMGRCLAALHQGLSGYPLARAARRALHVDPSATQAQIAALIQRIGARPSLAPADAVVLAELAGRQRWIVQAGAPPPQPDGALQLVHGDFQASNLFFAGGRVSAIIDWDQTYAASREWEIVRTLHLVWMFAPDACRAFLRSYGSALPLDLARLDRAATYYCWYRAHDLWAHEALYVAHNERVRAFIDADGFHPLIERWEVLRAQL